MVLTNYKKAKVAIVYTSVTGNTKELTLIINQIFQELECEVSLYSIGHFPFAKIAKFDAIIIGTYTWGDGQIPNEMNELYQTFESQPLKSVVTGVFGTGDSFYSHFCGAVDQFRDMLYVKSVLVATLKVELLPQQMDYLRCLRFVEILNKHLSKEN